jgi:hypothetical protein
MLCLFVLETSPTRKKLARRSTAIVHIRLSLILTAKVRWIRFLRQLLPLTSSSTTRGMLFTETPLTSELPGISICFSLMTFFKKKKKKQQQKRETIGPNFFGTRSLTYKLLAKNKIRERIITVTSTAGKFDPFSSSIVSKLRSPSSDEELTELAHEFIDGVRDGSFERKGFPK